MFQLDHILEVDAPAETVWKVLTDFQSYGEWNPFTVAAKCDLKPGGAIEMQVKLMAKPQFQREWIREVTPGQGFSYAMKPMPLGALRSFRSHRIEPVSATHCRYRSHFEIQGWLEGLVLALFKGAFERGFGGMSQGIKTRAESLWAAQKK